MGIEGLSCSMNGWRAVHENFALEWCLWNILLIGETVKQWHMLRLWSRSGWSDEVNGRYIYAPSAIEGRSKLG